MLLFPIVLSHIIVQHQKCFFLGTLCPSVVFDLNRVEVNGNVSVVW